MLDTDTEENRIDGTPNAEQHTVDRKPEFTSIGEHDLHISGGLWDEICNRVKSISGEGDEFLVFLLAKEGGVEATKAINVGIGYKSGVSWSAKQAIELLGEDISAGFRIVGDLHNHPDVPSYVAAGLPAYYTSSPSISDLDTEEIEVVRSFFDQTPWPRTIMCFDEESGKVYANTYRKNRSLSDVEERQASFEDPLFVETEQDNNRIKFHASLFLNPELLVQNGIISLGDVHVHLDDHTAVETNQLKSLVRPEGIES